MHTAADVITCAAGSGRGPEPTGRVPAPRQQQRVRCSFSSVALRLVRPLTMQTETAMTEIANRIVLAEEDPATRAFLAENLTADGYDVLVADDKPSALAKLAVKRPDLVVCDVNGDQRVGRRLPARRRRSAGARRQRVMKRAPLRRSPPPRSGPPPRRTPLTRTTPLPRGRWRKPGRDERAGGRARRPAPRAHRRLAAARTAPRLNDHRQAWNAPGGRNGNFAERLIRAHACSPARSRSEFGGGAHDCVSSVSTVICVCTGTCATAAASHRC